MTPFLIISVFFSQGCNPDEEILDNTIYPLPIYHSPETLEEYLLETNQKYPDITYLEPIGTSIEGRTIWGFVISDKPLDHELEPKIRLTGSIHGDENITTEVLIHMIEHITNGYYNNDQRIRAIVDNRYTVFIPMMNPDGVANESRYNANNVDLNRNFEVKWQNWNRHGQFPFSESESKSLKDYSLYMVFQLSLSFHSGAVLVNMPFDYASEHDGGDIPQEYDLICYLAKVYTTSGRFLETEGMLNSPNMDEGTINGGDWFIAYGTLQDWSYIDTGAIDFTVEITKNNPTNIEEINDIFELNRDSILSYIESAGIGIHGRVVDVSEGEVPVSATITIDAGDINTYSDAFGYYHRILLPGNYIITFTADGYEEYSKEIEITESSPLIEMDVVMEKNI